MIKSAILNLEQWYMKLLMSFGLLLDQLLTRSTIYDNNKISLNHSKYKIDIKSLKTQFT